MNNHSEKVLVEVYVPEADRRYDLWLPVELRVYELTILITKAIADISKGTFINTQDKVLYYQQGGDMLDNHANIRELTITNGEKLLLM